MSKYIIVDWANNICFNGQTFKSFDDAWDFLFETFPDDDQALDDYLVIKKELV